MDKSLQDAMNRIKAVTTSDGEGGDFIPLPLAREFIKFIFDANWMRQLFRVIPMNAPTRDFPKVLGQTKVYYQNTERGAATQTSVATGTVRLTARKFMSQINVSEEILEDAQEDIDLIVRDHFAKQLAAAEEEAMLVGDRAHALTTATESAANATTWFNKDHRLALNGLLTLAQDIVGDFDAENRAGNRVNGQAGDFSTRLAREAKFNMGKYGRTMSDLILIVNPWSANQLLDDDKLVTVEKYGPKATILTGEFGKLYGRISVVESAYMTNGHAVLTHRNNGYIGDRRKVRLRTDDEIQTDERLYVITERIDFQTQYQPALVNIYNLDEPATTS